MEEKQKRKPSPRQQPGGSLELWVHFGQQPEPHGKIELQDTADVADLRNVLLSTFPESLKGCKEAANLVVRTSPNEPTPIGNNGPRKKLWQEPLFDQAGQPVDIYVEGPKTGKRALQATIEVIDYHTKFTLSEVPSVCPTTRQQDTKADIAVVAKPFAVGVAVDPKSYFFYKRHSLENLVTKLRKTTISVVHAHRQAGKTTFVRQQLNDGRAWVFGLDNVKPEHFAQIESLDNLDPCKYPSMIIVDEAQCCKESNAHTFMGKLRGKCQDTHIPLIAVGLFTTIAFLQKEWADGMPPINTDSIYQLEPLSLDETHEFFAQASNECGFIFGEDVVKAIYDMSAGNVGFLGMVGSYLNSRGWNGKPFLIMDYYRAFNSTLRDRLLAPRSQVLDEIFSGQNAEDLIEELRFSSQLTQREVGPTLGSLLAAGVLLTLDGVPQTPAQNAQPVTDAKFVVASPLYRHYLSSSMPLPEQPRDAKQFALEWPAVHCIRSVLSGFDAHSLSLYASSSSSSSSSSGAKYAYQAEFAKAMAQHSRSLELLCEVHCCGRGQTTRADFLLGKLSSDTHVIELLVLKGGEPDAIFGLMMMNHAQRALIYKEALGARTASLICFCEEVPKSFVTFRDVPVFYVWPADKRFSGLVLASPDV